MRKIICVVYVYLHCLVLLGQQARFITMDREDGLPHSSINHIVQDQTGYLYIGTVDGLVRYDGYQFRVFRPDLTNPYAIHDSWIVDLFADSHGRIWSRFSSGGISVYDPNTERFTTLLHDPLDSTTMSSDDSPNPRMTESKNIFVESANGDIWIASVNGLNQVDPISLKVRRYYGGLEIESGLSGSMISTLYLDDELGILWIGTETGLTRFNLRSKATRHFTTEDGLTDNSITYIFKDTKGVLWLGGRRAGLMRCELDKSQNIRAIKGFFNRTEIPYENRSHGIHKILESSRGDIWVGLEQGLFMITQDGQKIKSFLDNKPSSIVRAIVEDNKGNIWAGGGSAELGLIQYSYQNDLLTEYNEKDVASTGYSSNLISALFIDRSGVLWISTSKGGIMRANLEGKKFESFSQSHFHAISKDDDEVFAIYCDSLNNILVGTRKTLFLFDQKMNVVNQFNSGAATNDMSWNLPGVLTPIPNTNEVWVGFFEGKISKFNIKTKQFKNYVIHDPKNPKSFVGWSLRAIKVASDGTTYFAPMSGGLIYLPKGESDFHHFDEKIKLPVTSIYSLMEDSKKQIWIGTSNNGVVVYDPKTVTGQFIKQGPEPNGLTHNEIRAIYEGKDGMIWLGTRYGLNQYNPKTNKSRHFRVENGMLSNIVHGIEEDSKGNIWFSTNMGIGMLDIQTMSFVNYLAEDGLQANEFNEGAVFKDKQGRIYFGGIDGITRFHPDSIKVDNASPKVVLTSIAVNQQILHAGDKVQDELLLKKNIESTEKIVLPFALNNFSVSFSTLDYRIPEKNRFRYRLMGLYNEWSELPLGEHTATFGWLPAGEFLFEIQATNIDGEWSKFITSVEIIILPPWWKTIWFKIASVFTLILVIVGLFIINTRRLTLQRKLLEKTVAERTEELVLVNLQMEAQQNMVVAQNQELQTHQKELEQQRRNIELLSEMGQKITASVELRDVFMQIFRIVGELIHINELMVGHLNEEKNSLEIWGVKSTSDAFTHDEISMRADDRLSIYTAHHNQQIVSNNLQITAIELLGKPNDKYLQQDSPRSGIYLPLRGPGGKVKGVMVALAYDYDVYQPKDVILLENLASYVSIALDNASAYERIKMQSEQLLQVDKIKTDFYANVSHEFRTPLSLIQGPVEELIKSGRQSATDIKMLGVVKKNSQLMLNLVEQILELSKIDGGAMKVKKQESCISDQFKSIVESFRHLAIQKSIHFTSSLPPEMVRAVYDHDILNKITYNLLNNAIKYTQNGGKVEFVLEYQSDGLRFQVIDNGRGIPEEDLKHIFDRFYRGSLTLEYQEVGAGIGLAHVHQLVDMVGGKIEAKSQFDRNFSSSSGTTFTVLMPLEALSKSNERSLIDPDLVDEAMPLDKERRNEFLDASGRADDLLKTKILIVEDNEDLLEFIKNKLSIHYKVLTAKNGREALDIARNEQPQLVISDVMMPVMNGIDFCKALKADIDISHTPVILLTAKDAEDDENLGLVSGANDYIVKPFDMDQLIYKVRNILKNRLELIGRFKESIWTGIQDLGDQVSPQDQEFLTKVKGIIEKQIKNPDLDIDYFCSELGVSRTWLYNKMKVLLDMSMNDFIRNCRLKHGAKLLVSERLSISQTAYAVGFNDPKYFTRCFKKEFNMGPKTYIKQMQKNA